jgi:hypothetical protein
VGVCAVYEAEEGDDRLLRPGEASGMVLARVDRPFRNSLSTETLTQGGVISHSSATRRYIRKAMTARSSAS